ncbi:hypothetical protein [Pseudonocardia sp. ICBG1034]|uniref:hypothetical protein n=1 Tax=Pseudonocardia sp. ICBG1034 TaxID=2844381 RepID=UPI001CCDB6A5|nr:hypothetical protein [Pseudonocardia sp. ICBG1034]
MSFRSEPSTTSARISRLNDYFSRKVLADGEMICGNASECKRSALSTNRGTKRPGVSYAQAQLPHVGQHFDLFEDDVPIRTLVIGMEMGEGDEYVSITQRRQQIMKSAARSMTQRNPHMQGVTNALRLTLGRPVGGDRAGEILDLDGPVHVFDTCATTNLRLCSAYSAGRKSHGTDLMTKRCLRHLAATIEILEPTLVIAQGQVGKAIWPIVDDREDAGDHLSRVVVRGVSTLLARFTHPSAWGKHRWGGLDHPYLQETVEPVLVAARFAAR